jgi:hypothetical protein
MAEKKKNPQFITPRGPLKWPKLTAVDYGTKDYPNPKGSFSTKVVFQAADPAVKAFLAKLQPLYAQAMADAQEEFKKLKVETRKKLKNVTENPLFTTLYDKETEEPTGEIEMKFSMAASGERKDKTTWFARPSLFDAKGNPILVFDRKSGATLKSAPDIWSGTIAKVSFEAIPYFIPGTGAAGLSLKLKGVQIIDLVSGGQRSASSFGFEEEEGYEFDSSSASTDTVDESDEFGDESSSSSNDEEGADF